MSDHNTIRLPKNIWVRRFLFLLAAGVSLSLSTNPRQHLKLLKTLPKEWKKINHSHIYRLTRSLARRDLISYKPSKSTTPVLITSKGRQYLKRLEFADLKLPQTNSLDQKWHLILFDIPEPRKRSRDALRKKLKELGCVEVQKSVFAWPYNCRKEVEIIVTFFNIEDHVVYAESKIENDRHLRKLFNLV